ncbi:spermine/spermidine synthase [Melghirimyces algeriensis]|uniref:Spermine/spermidine synthase n=1 Tax=Melghirimyces algeriensis TaxID=910412 RepID=A0A521AEZ9_9BACL|nr:spermine/spermidine synthase [Melghirimyces algeriensis]SMO33358.1 Spermine/spermidine synthase [Melghirimyces algeriensis]
MYHVPEVIERCQTSRGELQLQRRNGHYELISNGSFLMATYNGDSERALVRSALRKTRFPHHLLIGGLGVGFSLDEALTHPQVQQVTVVEIESSIIRWYKEYFCHNFQHGLDDPRIRLIRGDLIDWIDKTKEKYDVICLDIDNGPDWTVYDQNQKLYTKQGIHQLKQRLAPNGVISFWSASPSEGFHHILQSHFKVETVTVPHFRGDPDYLFIAQK